MGCRIDPSRGGPRELFLVPAMLHDWCNKGRGVCYPVCGMVHIKEPLLLIGKSSPCGSSGFTFSLSEWSLAIWRQTCLISYNCKYKCVECVVKTCPYLIPSRGFLTKIITPTARITIKIMFMTLKFNPHERD